ncbi:MAG: 50S ribosomal protein L10 [Candidatus Magasanikbacteria bacterium CG11_big_fil_rev_8_21_14_0_20_43_7]|uniref:Large ribosomal subunit protein uL10 n=1 Tax=Candidatus Magasanikbacteria bacterium CG11_big_fil_rev_8_21_14_0_20_43_7 TaxID=1974654 RepID=A0A2H0N388_9BACT|nr:MAG: 50S ribosomal protein L10 [Candidatus Magasanikbacteria bacterium CG11_big_fil_rev_8_21_14_0_20_43_7]
MAKTKVQKEEASQALADNLKKAKAVVFANFQGLTVAETEELRAKCRKNNIVITASKKTVLKHALKDVGFNIDTKAFEGGVATACGTDDEVAPAQVIATFAKAHELVTIFGGILEGQFIDAAKVKELSLLPSKQELYAKLVGTLNAPISGFVNVLAGNLRNFVGVLNAIKEQKA